MKTHKRKTNKATSLNDYIKAARRGNRDGEREALGDGFHSTHHIHKSKKTYSRKLKHRNRELN